jgi:hypothetical protein
MIDHKKVFNGIVGKRGYSLENIRKDSDGDRFVNVIDCQPYNSKKDGWWQDAKEKVKAAVETHNKVKEEERENRYLETTKANEAAREERLKQATKTAAYREQLRGERQRESLKSGGFFGQAMKQYSSFAKPKTKTSSGKRIKRTVYVKKGKHYVKRTTYSKPKTAHTTKDTSHYDNPMERLGRMI